MTPTQLHKLRRAPVNGAGNRLGAAFKIAKTSAAAMWRATGLSQQYISDVKRGRYDDLTLGNAQILAGFFGCSTDVLFPPRKRGA